MALMTVVGMGAVTVAAQETPTPVENETNATANETVAADNETEAIAEDNETETIAEDNETVAAGMNETANVTFGNQSTNGTFVVVNETVLPEGGFVAIFTVNESLAENVTNETAAGANVTTPTEEGLNVTEAEENETEFGAEENVTNESEFGAEENETNETEFGAEENVTNETEVGMTPTPEAGANASVVSIDQINNSTLGMFVGNSTYLDPGTHENVLVDYRSQIRQTNDQVLIAVAYQDTNDNQTFDGVENESAYVANGTIVADQAYVTVEEDVTANVTAAPAEEGLNETEAGLNETGEPMTPTPAEEGLNETGAGLNETEEAATPTAAEEGLNETDGVENATGADETPTPTPFN